MLALSAAGLTITGVALYVAKGAEYAGVSSVCLRAGLVLGALALALPQVKRLFERVPPWYLACVTVGFLFVIRWPTTIGVVAPVLVGLWFLGPRNRQPPIVKKRKTKPKATARHS
jgi:hypothetical protein